MDKFKCYKVFDFLNESNIVGIIIVNKFLYFFLNSRWTLALKISSGPWVLDAHHTFLDLNNNVLCDSSLVVEINNTCSVKDTSNTIIEKYGEINGEIIPSGGIG